MNIEETKNAIAVMQAFVDGKDLEQINGTGGYSRNYCPKWNWDDDRIITYLIIQNVTESSRSLTTVLSRTQRR